MSIKSRIRSFLRMALSGPSKHITADVHYSFPNDRLKGKKIVITGGGHGLGASMAEKFVKEGASILIAGRNESVLRQTAERLECNYLRLDVSAFSSFSAFMDKADEILGGIDALVNNAGISLHENSFFDVTQETFDAQVDTNLKGAFFLTQEFIKRLRNHKKGGSVLFISSETGNTMDFRPYGFTKAAVNSMVQGLAYLFNKEGIRINAVAPGVTASSMTGMSADGDLYYPYNPIERVYLPEEVAETACFLLSDVSACISGQIITCNNAKTVNARWK